MRRTPGVVLGLCLLLAGPASAEGEPYGILPENASPDLLRQIKSLVFYDREDPLSAGFVTDLVSPGYRLTRQQWDEIRSSPWVVWSKPGYERTEEGFALEPGDGYGRAHAATRQLRVLFQEMGDAVFPAGGVSMATEEVMIARSEDYRGPSVDIFSLPSVVARSPMEDFTARQLAAGLDGVGHYFTIARVRENPPMLQEEVLYVRLHAGIRAYCLRGPAYPVTIE